MLKIRRSNFIKLVLVIVLLLAQFLFIISCNKNNQKTVKETASYMVEMSDGVKLATDVYLPKEGTSFPIILYRTPYNKDTDKGPLDYINEGIGIVVQDMRGCHKSGGEYAAFGTEGKDSLDTVNWLKTQSWFNGNYATWGDSARGITQYMQAPYLTDVKAQHIQVATPDLYSKAIFYGGAPSKMLTEDWLNGIGHGDYYAKIFDMLGDEEFINSHRVNSFANVTWPAIHKGGWFDCFGQGTVDGFMGYQYLGGEGGKGNSKLIMGPWTHWLGLNKVGDLTFPENAKNDPWSNKIFYAMFAEKLFGVPNYNNLGDYRTMPNVTYYVMGDTQNQSNLWNQWATADEWPIAHTQKNFYLQGNNTLNESIPAQNKDYSYSFDPSKPIATRGGANLNQDNRGSFDQNAIENGRNDIIHFDYAIEEPLLITGRVLAKLFVKSDCVDTDFTVKLMDVYPDGKSWLISDGIVRMRYRNGMESEQFMDASNQTVYETMVDLWSTSYYFSEGHTLRIAISSSNYPRFDVNPNTGAKMSPATTSTPYNIANNTIVVSPDYPSALILPIPNSAPRYVYG